MNKKEARTLIKERRMNLSKEYIDVASDKIFEKLLQNEDFKNAKIVMSYMDFKNEVKTEKPVEMPKSLPIGDKNINSTATANSKATTTGQLGTNGVQGGSGTNTDELNAYRAAIRREIERHKRYPARAKMMRKQGVVSVSFSVSSDGSLSGERVTNSSGDESLDNAALEAVRSARPVGPKPAGFASSVSVPISFTIQ